MYFNEKHLKIKNQRDLLKEQYNEIFRSVNTKTISINIALKMIAINGRQTRKCHLSKQLYYVKFSTKLIFHGENNIHNVKSL